MFLALVLTILSAVMVYVYQYAGLKYFIRAKQVMNTIPDTEQRQQTWERFNGTGRTGEYRGILAGSWMGKVWVWGRSGLVSFNVDEYSVYSWFDGCSEPIKTQLNTGTAKGVERVVGNDFRNWRGKAEAGDYVTTFVTQPETGGAIGNLRELYDYNFWVFIRDGIDEQCAK